MVFIHGEDFAAGDAMMYAGHVLAKKEVVVITLNYRLGALGKTNVNILLHFQVNTQAADCFQAL